MRLGIVVAEFNYDITRLMYEKAVDHAKFLGVEEVEVLWVPGVFETPLGAKALLEKGVDAVAVLGAVIKGETDHDRVVADQAARKIMDLALEYGKPVTLGIIGPGATRDQAAERIEEYARRAVEAAVKMYKRLQSVRG